MAWIVFIYLLFVVVTGVSSMFRGEFLLGLAGALGPILALIGGAGITSAKQGANSRSAGTIIVGLMILGIATYWLWSSGWRVSIFSIETPGAALGVVGFFLGLIYGVKGFNEA